RLENILNGLDLPLASVPDRPDGEPLTLHDADGIAIVLKRGADGLWRFDRPTVEHIPTMHRTAVARQKNLQASRAALRESYTDAPPFTWHADRDGRIFLERIHPAEGKDAWLFNRHTVANLPRMYAAAQPALPDSRFVRLGLVVPPLRPDGSSSAVAQKPDSVP